MSVQRVCQEAPWPCVSIHVHCPLRLVREAPSGGGFVLTGGFLVARPWVGSCSCLTRACRSLIVGSMKLDPNLARSPLEPARAHVRLSQADMQIALHSLDPRLSQATTLAASTPLDPDSPETEDRP